MFGVPLYIILARRFDVRWLMMLGLASFGIAMWTYSWVTHDWGGDQFFLPQVLRGLPQVFAVAPSVTLGLGSLPPERLKYASGLFNMMRNLGGARGLRRNSEHPHEFSFFGNRIESHTGEWFNGAAGR
jgi:MFS transporter, DHA2 family, multidrug resistance protein